MLGTTIAPLFPKAASATSYLNQRAQLVLIADYIGNYMSNWSEFSPTAKMVPFEFYADNSEFELSGDRRVNQLQFIDPLLAGGQKVISNYYKTSIKFWETNVLNRAVINVKVWYDSNLNDVIDPGENMVSFSTILIEKRK
jgi:hypothetical protein